MIVNYLGGASFKISQGDLSIAVNPQNNRGNADITLVSSSEFAIDGGKGFVITGPGEYEVKDVGIKGFFSKSGDRVNTIYMISFEGMNLCFLGALTDPELSSDTKENLEDIDMLFVPVDTMDVAAAYKLAVSLEPSVIIPMQYTNDSLKKFLKESGSEGVKPIEKLVVKKKDLDGKEGEIITLESSNE
jgi:hypothetical protein